ncbi:MAG: SDR family NAD(P)-dependent oxidoreductase [Pseudomonadota bacterium]
MTKIALVTGASRGLGAALAEALAPQFHIVAVARTVGGLEELDDRIKAKGGEATLAPLNITDEGAMAHLCRSLHDRWGPAALWVHTAVHAPPLSPAPHADPKDFAKTLDVNVTATQRLIRMVGALLGQDGRAVFFDDARAGEKFFSLYGASKAAQIALARSWAAETERTGPSVAVLSPAPMSTAVRARFFPGEDRASVASPKAQAEELLAQVVG